ncbi:Hypothetical protein PHPALM_7151 [Phytophthora palmivora]|uniref:Uncharacterized protein n=1 Tax=Phytophthora palmivora TaxID=4796 RepID=A0A2P4YD27_9STRA|nr:Hypothetical protein PHPALM_7151 [Phytophthora palmivora]
MGTSTSKTSPLAPTFERMATWDLKASRALLQTYKDKDLDFGLDSQGLADLVGGDKDWAENIIDAFKSPTGMAGVGNVPSDEELESVTLQAYRDLNKGSTQSISKAEFTKWILEFASGTQAPVTREVTLQNALEQFRVIPPTNSVEEKESNNIISPQEGNEAPIPQNHDDTDELNADEASIPPHQDDSVKLVADEPQQKTNDDDVEFIPDQEHEHLEKSTEFSELIEPELVPTDANQHVSSEIFEASEHGTVQTAAVDNDLNDDNDQGEEQSQTHGIVDQVEEVHANVNSGDEPEQQIINESHDHDLEAADDHGVTRDTESDFPTFVADVDEQPPANDEQDNCTSTDEQANKLNAESLGAENIDVDIQGDVNNNGNIETEDTEPVVASEKLEAEDSPSEPMYTAELETDDLEYEQEEFAPETPRPNDVGDDNPSSDNAEQSQENAEQDIQPPVDPIVEMVDPVTNTDVHELISAQGAENGANVDETSASIVTPDEVPTSENAEAGEEVIYCFAVVLDDAVTADAVPAVDTSVDAFDKQDVRFGECGLPPPESQEPKDDTAATAVDPGDAHTSHEQ